MRGLSSDHRIMIAQEWLCGGPDAPPIEARLRLVEQLQKLSGAKVLPTKWGERPPKSQVRVYPHRVYGVLIPDAAIWVVSPEEVAQKRLPPKAPPSKPVRLPSLVERVLAVTPNGEQIRKSLTRGRMSRSSLEAVIRAAQQLKEKA
jgi:hypothetical protein